MSRLTKRQRELKARHIKVIKEYGGYRPELSMGVQSFGIGDICAGKKGAEWTATMLAIALDNLLIDEAKPDAGKGE